jgi:pimeloyl-ACP methyl ester carboxylesterase
MKEPAIGHPNDPAGKQRAAPSSRRQLLKVSAALAALPFASATAASGQTANPQATKDLSMTDAKSQGFIDGMADLMAHSTRTPILRWPDEYGMDYEEIFFPALDGVTIEGWFIPGKSDRLLIMNHPMPCNRYGYPGHLDPWKDFGGFEVNFLPEYKILHDAGYNILTYDMRNHGRSGTGSGGVNGHGVLEYRDVIGSLRYAKSRSDTRDMKAALYSRCLGANATIVGMKKHPEAFKDIKAMIALQPVTPGVFVQTAMEREKIPNGVERFDAAFHKRTGYRLADVWPMEYAKAVTVPTLVAQVRNDFLTKPSNVQEIYDTLSSKDKKLFWIEGADQRFQGYNYFGKNPQLVLDWFGSHMA